MNMSKFIFHLNLSCRIFHLTGGAEGSAASSSTDAEREADTFQEGEGRGRKLIICKRDRQQAATSPSTTPCSGQALIF